jgi:predicted outer membrane repeat protein
MVGGAIYLNLIKKTRLNIINSIFKNCYSGLYRENSRGGAIYIDLKLSVNSMINIINSIFINNIAKDYGGAIAIDNLLTKS